MTDFQPGQEYRFPIEYTVLVCYRGDEYTFTYARFARIVGTYHNWYTNQVHPEFMEWRLELSTNGINWVVVEGLEPRGD